MHSTEKCQFTPCIAVFSGLKKIFFWKNVRSTVVALKSANLRAEKIDFFTRGVNQKKRSMNQTLDLKDLFVFRSVKHRHRPSKNVALRMSMIHVLTFVTCWTPYLVSIMALHSKQRLCVQNRGERFSWMGFCICTVFNKFDCNTVSVANVCRVGRWSVN